MKNRPILLGIIVFAVSLSGWVVSVVLNVLTWGAFRWASNVFGIMALISLPTAVIVKLIMKRSVGSKKDKNI